MKNYKPWTEQEFNLLKEKAALGTVSFPQMKEFFPERTVRAIYTKAWENNIKTVCYHQKWNYNRDYFKIPNYRNCFWAGWLAADGSIEERGTTEIEKFDLRWECNSQDLNMMEIFKKDIEYNGPIVNYIKAPDKRPNIHSKIKLNGLRQMAIDIKTNFGYGPQKTYHLPPPNLNKLELKLAFLVGYLNGDGWISVGKNNLAIGFVSSSTNILNWIKKLIDSLNLPQKVKRETALSDKKGCHSISYGGTRAIYLYWLLKRVPVPILDRKWNNPKVESFISQQLSNHPEWFQTKIEDIERKLNIIY